MYLVSSLTISMNVEYIPWTVNLICLTLVSMTGSTLQQIQKTLSMRIKASRKELGMSQEELADMADIDRTYISQLERALVNPSLAILVRVANSLNIPLKDLLS